MDALTELKAKTGDSSMDLAQYKMAFSDNSFYN
jgi:hypothetical protein